MVLLAHISAASVLAQAGNAVDWVRLVVIVLVFGASGLGWIWRTLKEKRAEKIALDERRRRQEEALRTGQPYRPEPIRTAAPASTASASGGGGGSAEDVKRRLQELAQRRRAELEALRRNAQGGGAGGGSAGSPTPQARPAVAPQRPQPVSTMSPQPQQRYAPGQSPEEVAERRRRQAAAQRQAQTHAQAEAKTRAQADTKRREQEAKARAQSMRPVGPEAARTQQIAQAAQAVVLAAAAEAAQLPSPRAGSGGIGMTAFTGKIPSAASPEGAAAWRQFIVATEVLGKPVALRDEDESFF